MIVIIDRDRCTGHGRCYSLAPDVFDADDDGFGVLVEIGVPLTTDHLEHARLAVENCPESAITIAP